MKKYVSLAAFMFAVQNQVSAECIGANFDYLYWNAQQSDMVYAVVANSGENLFGDNYALFQTSDWAWGFRLGAGYAFPACWDTYFNWTRYHHRFTNRATQGFIIATPLIGPVYGNPIIGYDPFGSGPATSTWSLKFDRFELDFGSWVYETNAFCFHPTIGIQGLIVNQNQRSYYDNFIDTNTNRFANVTVHSTNNFWGIGPSMGCSGACNIGWGLSLQGNFSLAAFYGRLPSNTQIDVEDLGPFLNPGSALASTRLFQSLGATPTFPPHTSTELNRNKLIPSLQLFFGLGWGMDFGRGVTCDVSVGYEVQYLWGLWRTQNSGIQTFYIPDSGYDALELDGLTFRFTFGF